MASDTIDPTQKQKGQQKTARVYIPIKPMTIQQRLPKPHWIRVKAAAVNSRFQEVKRILREHRLHSVCEEASCPNIGECFGKGTATFMIMGDKCTRRCTFCDVGHGRPDALDTDEPRRLAETIGALQLNHVVITSVDRDDLLDGGAQHFADCIRWTREMSPTTRIEILVPDFRGRLSRALDVFSANPLPDIFNHNLETIQRLYRAVRPGSDYQHSLQLLQRFKENHPHILTKCGVMVGLGENDDEILATVRDIHTQQVDMLTIGQYLQPSLYHAPVDRYVPPEVFRSYEAYAYELGFLRASCGPLVRSSYHADEQAPAN